MPADICDQADEYAALMLKIALTNQNNRPKPPPETGRCGNCQESIPVGRFCDADCRDDYERLTRNRRLKL